MGQCASAVETFTLTRCDHCLAWLDKKNGETGKWVKLDLNNGLKSKTLCVHEGCAEAAKADFRQVCAQCKKQIDGTIVRVQVEKTEGDKYYRKDGRVCERCESAYRKAPPAEADQGKCTWCHEGISSSQTCIEMGLSRGRTEKVHKECKGLAEKVLSDVCAQCKKHILTEQTNYKASGNPWEGGCRETPLHTACVEKFRKRKLPPAPKKDEGKAEAKKEEPKNESPKKEGKKKN